MNKSQPNFLEASREVHVLREHSHVIRDRVQESEMLLGNFERMMDLLQKEHHAKLMLA